MVITRQKKKQKSIYKQERRKELCAHKTYEFSPVKYEYRINVFKQDRQVGNTTMVL